MSEFTEEKVAGEAEITILRFVSKEKGRGEKELCRVELDGSFWQELEPETIVRKGLKKGASLDEATRKEVLLEDETIRARFAGARRIAGKPRARRELVRYLREKKYGSEAIEAALDQLEESGYIDDREVAARHVRKRLRAGGYGERRIRAELREMGVASEAIEREMQAALGEEEPSEACRQFVEKKVARYRPLSDAKNRNRFTSLLIRRGFDIGVIRDCLDSIASDERQ